MLELLRYFPAAFLDLTYEIESQLEVDRTHDEHHKVTVRANGPLAVELIKNSAFPEKETSSTLIIYKCLGLFQKKGPVIVRPALNLCQALLDTEIREVLFKDLFIRDRPHEDYREGTGSRKAAQHRRGHWKRVAHGEKFSLRKWLWINDYWTHRDEVEPGQKPPTIILK